MVVHAHRRWPTPSLVGRRTDGLHHLLELVEGHVFVVVGVRAVHQQPGLGLAEFAVRRVIQEVDTCSATLTYLVVCEM